MLEETTRPETTLAAARDAYDKWLDRRGERHGPTATSTRSLRQWFGETAVRVGHHKGKSGQQLHLLNYRLRQSGLAFMDDDSRPEMEAY